MSKESQKRYAQSPKGRAVYRAQALKQRQLAREALDLARRDYPDNIPEEWLAKSKWELMMMAKAKGLPISMGGLYLSRVDLIVRLMDKESNGSL